MNITLLYGDPRSKPNDLKNFVDQFDRHVSNDHTIFRFNLDEMNLHYCTGCWSCWWKTPGLCALKDDGSEIFHAVIKSGLLIMCSPLIAGFTSASLKKITDRLIVLLHPYIEIRNNESHHRKRYDTYPDIGIILEKETITDSETDKILRDIYDRLALNFHAKLQFMKYVDELKPESIIHETSHN